MRLEDYCPPLFQIERVSLCFWLQAEETIVENTMHIKRLRAGPLELMGEALSLLAITMDEEPLPSHAFEKTAEGLRILDCKEEFVLTIKTACNPTANTALNGLYYGHALFCTQCEAEGFRRITYFLDRPDVLTLFTTKIIADAEKYPVLLSNGNLIESGTLPQGKHYVVWEDPFKKPSYLFALVAGDLRLVQDTYVTASKRKVDIHLYVEPGNEAKCAHALSSIKKAMRWDEEEFGREYDLSIFMIVAVHDFNMGAMENKGLNIFNAKYILACPDTATDTDFIDIESVVGHEYFHNWTGNRVTCRDWFQLSLKEGLTVYREQEFSRAMQGEVMRIEDVRVLQQTQFPEDAGAMAHPVRPDAYEEINNFYTATIYNKGAEVIRMQRMLLGKAGFRKGMDLYFQRHDGEAVTIEDFVSAMEEANQVDFTQLQRWYTQAGTPRVEVKTTFSQQTLTLTLRQFCPPTAECKDKKPFHIPIAMALFTPEGKEIPLASPLLELKQAEQTFVFENLKEKPLVSLLREFSAPILLVQDQTDAELLALLRFEKDSYAKWNAAQILLKTTMLSFYQKGSQEVGEALIEAYSGLLSAEHPSLCAELLTLPDWQELLVSVQEADVIALLDAKEALARQLGSALYEKAEQKYQALWQEEKGLLTPAAFANRKLRNRCLWWMMKGNPASALLICQEQFVQAKTMTDSIASFTLLNQVQDPLVREQAIRHFYQRWQNNELVLDKWFSIQASCEEGNALERVQALLQHPAFSMQNPNKVRAVLGSFCQNNPRHFHAIDGSGYTFLQNKILALDAINPQIAARLAMPFTRYKAYDKKRQALLQEVLLAMQKTLLSKELSEVVSKSLGA